MATGKTRKTPTKSKAAKSAKTAQSQSAALFASGQGPNRLLIGPDDRLVLQSGQTGQIFDIDPALRPQIEALLQQRQQAGIALTQLLEDHGMDVAPAIPVFFDD